MKTMNKDVNDFRLGQNPLLLKLDRHAASTIRQLMQRLSQQAEAYFAYHRLNIAHNQYGKAPYELKEEHLAKIDQIALRQMMIENAVLQSSEADLVSISHQEIFEAYQDVLKQYYDDHDRLNLQDFQQSLKRCNLTESCFYEALIRQICVEKVMQFVADQIEPVTEIMANTYYQANLKKFVQPEYRIARHILVTIQENLPDNTYENALQRIYRILKHIKRKPSEFAAQALKYSECPTALQGGLLGKITKRLLYPPLDHALFEMRTGEISPVVQSEIGFHILYCESIHPEQTSKFADIKEHLIRQLTEKERQYRQKNWLKRVVNEQQSSIDTTISEKSGYARNHDLLV